jgi:hypothetical protein
MMRPILSAVLPLMLAQCALAARTENTDTCRRIENKVLRVTVDPASGDITVLDKRIGYTWRQAPPLDSAARLSIVRAQKPPSVDGDLGDWSAPVSFRLTPDMVADAKQVDGPCDLSGEVRVAWDDQALYLAATVQDEKHLFATAADREWWEKDSVEFWVNARQFGVALDPTAPALVLEGKPVPRSDYALAVRAQAASYVMEAALPWSVLGLPAGGVGLGKVFRFALGVNDADESGAREGQLYYPTSWVHSTPSTFALARFADERGHAPEAAPPPRLQNVRMVANGIAFETPLKAGAVAQATTTLTLPTEAADLVIDTDLPDRSVSVSGLEPIGAFVLDSKQAFMPFARYCDGLLMDCDDMRWRGNRLAMYSADMPWIGMTDLTKGYMLLAETPDDGVVELRASDVNGHPRLAPVMQWENSKGEFRYARRLRVCFLDTGGYVAICKRYRAYAKEHGLLVTQREKAKTIPDVARLAGAPDIWGAWGLDFCQQAKAAGIDRMIVNWRGSKEDMEKVKALGYLISEYDNYVDIQEGSLDQSERAPLPASAIKNAKGEPVQGWVTWDKKTVFMKLCPALAVKAASLRIPPVLAEHPFNARFLDVTTASGLLECYDPDHPLTREEYRHANEALAKYVSGLGLVLGGEHGRWYGAPYYNYWEGMQSGAFYSWPAGHVGIEIPQTRGEIGADYLKYGIGEVYRVPLWELCFHDCVVSTWYWGDSTGHLYKAAPDIADRKDLFNILYGTVPLYWVSQPYSFSWRDPALRERLLESYRNTCKLHEQIGFEELVSHEFVTGDHAVQKTVFGDGTEVWVNFGEQPWTLKRAKQEYVLPQYGFYAQGPKIEQYRADVAGKTTTLIRSDGYLFAEGSVPGLVETANGAPATIRRQGPAMLRVSAPDAQDLRLNVAALCPDGGEGAWRVLELDERGTPRAFGEALQPKGGLVQLAGVNGTVLLVGPKALAERAEVAIAAISPPDPISVKQGDELKLRVKLANYGGRPAEAVGLTAFAGAVPRAASGNAPNGQPPLSVARVNIPASGAVEVPLAIDTSRHDGNVMLSFALGVSGTDEICAADNEAVRTAYINPDWSRWDTRIPVTVEMGNIPRGPTVVVRMPFDADAERAKLGKAGAADPASIRVENPGAPPPLDTSPCQYSKGPDGPKLYWVERGPYPPDGRAECIIHLDGADAARHAPMPQRGWSAGDTTYRGLSYEVAFQEGYIRGVSLVAPRGRTDILNHLGVSSQDTGWVDEIGEVQSFDVLEDGPVLTRVQVRKKLRGDHAYDKLYTFYPGHFEVTTLSEERFGTLNRAYYVAPCHFEDDKGNKAIIDGKGDAEDVSGRNPDPKWYATWGPPGKQPPDWALSCVAVTPHDSLTYWDAGSWGGVGFNTGRKEPATVAFYLHRPSDEPDFSAPAFAAMDYAAAHEPIRVTR